MKKAGWFFRLSHRQPTPATIGCIAGGLAVAVLALTTGAAIAQDAVPATPPVAPNGYTLHESIDLGGHMAGISGSGAMYDTMVDLESGPRVLGETFELHALPGTKHTIVDSLSAFSNGWGGDPDDFARMDFYKGNLYEFSGTFTRDRQYFDYDLLGNPNIPSGQSIPISGGGSLASPQQVEQSPFLYNTVRQMTNTSLTVFPLSKVTYRVNYAHYVFAGPSLSPSGNSVGPGDILLEEMQRMSTDNFIGGVDWKVLPQTRLTFEEQIDHYKQDSYFTLDPANFTVQEADGTKVAPGVSYSTLTPYTCSASPVLTAPDTPGGLPVINPACNVDLSYLRTAPTRILFPTEIFRFQSSSIKNISMNGDVRYTDANMSLPSYYEDFQGLDGTERSLAYTANATAKREVMAADYGIEWQATRSFGFSDQLNFSNVQQPGTASMTSEIKAVTPSGADDTINYPTLTTTVINAPTTPATTPIEGSGSIGVPNYDFFGQRIINNDLTGTWYGSRATLSLTYRHRNHVIAEGTAANGGNTHSAPLAVGATSGGTVTINQNGGVFNAAVRPDSQWNINGSAEVLYADNVFTPVAPRQQQHYRVHAMYRPKAWATLTGAFNDMELHNNTDNNQAAVANGTYVYDGPLDHVAHTRIIGLGAALAPNAHVAFDFNYAYTDVYTATNICYEGGNSTALPVAAAPQSGAGCPGANSGRGTLTPTTLLEYGPVKDFMDAPTQSGQAAISLTPVKNIHSDIGYNISSVNGSRFYNDPRDVAGSLVSTYQSPFVDLAWTIRPGFIWKAEYNFYGYGEGGPSGAPYCSASTTFPNSTTPAATYPCNAIPSSLGLTPVQSQTGLTISPAGETAPRNFHANIATLGFHYEF